MSKERLEEIKKHRDEAENSIDEYEFEKINFYNLHVDWLIEQAERVQELETTVDFYQSALRDADRRVQELEEEIEDWRKEVKKWQRFFREESQKNKRYRVAIRECIERMNEGGAGTRSFVYEKLIEVLEGNNDA